MKFSSPTLRALLALVAGLLVGIMLDATDSSVLRTLARWLEPLGTLWINAIRMVVIPLVVSLVVVGVAGLVERQSLGRLGLRTFVGFVLVLS
ncbi:MAG: cation:dicarboxylate symporter family transporter, partial [Longimicrobiales bacterium]